MIAGGNRVEAEWKEYKEFGLFAATKLKGFWADPAAIRQPLCANMPRRSWTTAEQNAWLEPRLARFLQAREKGATQAFYANTWQEWFDKFPNAAPTPAELAAAEGDEATAIATKDKERRNVSKEMIE